MSGSVLSVSRPDGQRVDQLANRVLCGCIETGPFTVGCSSMYSRYLCSQSPSKTEKKFKIDLKLQFFKKGGGLVFFFFFFFFFF